MRPARLLLPCLAVLGLAASAAPAAMAAELAPGRVVVRFEPDATAAERTAARAAVDARIVSTVLPRTQVLDVGVGNVHASVTELERDAGVRWAEPLPRARVLWTPNDPAFASQWEFQNTGQTGGLAGADIDVVQAWDIVRGNGVLVGVADTGVDFGHPDTGILWTDPGEIPANGIDDDGNGFVDDVQGWDFVNADASPADDHDHGTAVGSLINGATNNATDMAGAAPGANVVHAKVLAANGSGWADDVAAGLDYLAEQGARIVNASLGGPRSQLYADVIARHPDTLFVVAAGNETADNDSAAAAYPCAEPLANILCVAASTHSDTLASFSNYGLTSVDVAAPGQGVHGLEATLGGAGLWNGTSFASPITAGVAALLLQHKPHATTAELKAAIMGSVDPVASLAGLTVSGGRVNARRALLQLDGTLQALPVNTERPSVSGSALNGSTVTAADGTWTGSPEFGYQWLRCSSSGSGCEQIPGETGASYGVTSADVGSRLRVRVTASNTVGSATAESIATFVVATAPANTVAPWVSGSAVEGAWLAADLGGWSPVPTGYSVSWLRCDEMGAACAAIPGANRQAYRLTAQDAGSTVRVRVVASNAAGASAPADSGQTEVVLAATSQVPGPGSVRSPYTVGPRPRISLVLPGSRALRVTRTGRTSLRLACEGASSCRAAVRVYLVRPGNRRGALVGSGRATVRASRSATARVGLTTRARRLLASRRGVRVIVEATIPGSRDARSGTLRRR